MTQTDDTQVTEPVIPSGDELYDLLMGKIEPDLTISQVETLAEKYKDETPETGPKKQLRKRPGN